MAKRSSGVWGIDIGQSALKALRCTIENGEIVADVFDYIEYPKILSQQDANPTELVREALTQFLSRNDVKGDRLALAVPGQNGLAKFFKPPPVDPKRIPEIVRYEARQQIPFDLAEVIWDFQQMGGGAEIDGLALETEVGLFAMKRDQVYRAIRPFDEADVELDIIQLAPLSIYNFVSYDLLADGPPADQFDPGNPPESIVVLSMGTDSTDLVVTNGFRVWQRSIPLGGNHFTKQLTKELKLTFAKAEHLKRNAKQAEDPKLVFQTMRPVFNDLVTEVQRSLGYFQGIDRQAKIGSVVMLGNAVKLPGLNQYLAKNLGYEIRSFTSFQRLGGSAVVSTPSFKDNVLAFGVCYGLCLQGLGAGRLSTNLMPREIMQERLIRAKKPWAVATLSVMLLACALSAFFYFGRWKEAHPDRWTTAAQQASTVESFHRTNLATDDELDSQLKQLQSIGQELTKNTEFRLSWLELMQAIDSVLPRDASTQLGVVPDPRKSPYDQRQVLYIEQIESQYFPDLTTWFTEDIKKRYVGRMPAMPEELRAQALAKPADNAKPAGDAEPDPNNPPLAGAETTETTESTEAEVEVKGPEGAGWVIELRGYHYYNKDLSKGTWIHVRDTLLRNLMYGKVNLPDGKGNRMDFTMAQLGITHPVLLSDGKLTPETIKDPLAEDGTGAVGGGATATAAATPFPAMGATPAAKSAAATSEDAGFKVKKFTFVVQFCWKESLLTKRLEAIRKAKEAEEQKKKDGLDQNVAVN